ncbi:MAG: ABC transporter permease [Bryobacterales bacterium]|nr:ABC transporter permease [Bryobacterales bacterium]
MNSQRQYLYVRDGTAYESAEYIVVAGDYFKAMGINTAGRRFAPGERGVVIVSKTLARRLAPHSVILGRSLLLDGESRLRTVIGVVDDVVMDPLDAGPAAQLYVPFLDPYRGLFPKAPLFSVFRIDREDAATEVMRAIRARGPFRISDGKLMKARLNAVLVPIKLRATLFTVFAILTIGLSICGAYSVLTYIVASRSRRLALERRWEHNQSTCSI